VAYIEQQPKLVNILCFTLQNLKVSLLNYNIQNKIAARYQKIMGTILLMSLPLVDAPSNMIYMNDILLVYIYNSEEN